MAIYDIRILMERFTTIGMRIKHISGLSGDTSENRLSRAATGALVLDGQEYATLTGLLQDCEELSRRSPLPISWMDLFKVREELAGLQAEKKRATDEDTRLLNEFARGVPLNRVAEHFGLKGDQDVLTRVQIALDRVGKRVESEKVLEKKVSDLATPTPTPKTEA